MSDIGFDRDPGGFARTCLRDPLDTTGLFAPPPRPKAAEGLSMRDRLGNVWTLRLWPRQAGKTYYLQQQEHYYHQMGAKP